MAQFASKLLALAYGVLGMCLLIPGLLVSASMLQEASTWATVAALGIVLLTGVTPVAAGIGLWQQRNWSKWLFLATACVAFIPLLFSLPRGMELYKHYTSPPAGSYKILNQEEFNGLFMQFVFQPLGVAMLALAAAVFVFFYFRPRPNPSIERDVQGLSPSAAPHVKR